MLNGRIMQMCLSHSVLSRHAVIKKVFRTRTYSALGVFCLSPVIGAARANLLPLSPVE